MLKDGILLPRQVTFFHYAHLCKKDATTKTSFGREIYQRVAFKASKLSIESMVLFAKIKIFDLCTTLVNQKRPS